MISIFYLVDEDDLSTLTIPLPISSTTLLSMFDRADLFSLKFPKTSLLLMDSLLLCGHLDMITD